MENSIKILGANILKYYVLSEVKELHIDEEFSKNCIRTVDSSNNIKFISLEEYQKFSSEYTSSQSLFEYLSKSFKAYHSNLVFFGKYNIDDELKNFGLRGFLKSNTYVDVIEAQGSNKTLSKSMHEEFDLPTEDQIKKIETFSSETFDENDEIIIPKSKKTLKLFVFGKGGSGKSTAINYLLGKAENTKSKAFAGSKIFELHEGLLFNNAKYNINIEVVTCADFFNSQEITHKEIVLEFYNFLSLRKFDLLIYTLPANQNRLTTFEVLLIKILLEFLSVKYKNDMTILLTKLDKLDEKEKETIKSKLSDNWLSKLNIEISPHQVSNIFLLDKSKSNLNMGLNAIINIALSNDEKQTKISIKFPDLSKLFSIGKETLFGSQLSDELFKLESIKKNNEVLRNSNINNLQVYIDKLVLSSKDNYFSIFNDSSNSNDLSNFILLNNDYIFNIIVFGKAGSGKSTLLNYLTGAKKELFTTDKRSFKNISDIYLGRMMNVKLNLYDTPGIDDIKYINQKKFFKEFNEVCSNKSISLILFTIRIDSLKVTRDEIFCKLLKYCKSSYDIIEKNIVIVLTFIDRITYEESLIIKKKIDNYLNEFNKYIGRKNFIYKYCIFNKNNEEKNYGLDDIIKYAVNSMGQQLHFDEIEE